MDKKFEGLIFIIEVEFNGKTIYAFYRKTIGIDRHQFVFRLAFYE